MSLHAYLEAPDWGITRRKANHEGLISLEAFEKIQRLRGEKPHLPTRKDISHDFVLRGAVCCAACGHPYTSGWSKGKLGKKYPYYFCQHKPCGQYGKTIQRDRMEGEFTELLQYLQPTAKLIQMAACMFKTAWDKQAGIVTLTTKQCAREVDRLEDEITTLVSRIMSASNPRVIAAYESHIGEIENH